MDQFIEFPRNIKFANKFKFAYPKFCLSLQKCLSFLHIFVLYHMRCTVAAVLIMLII